MKKLVPAIILSFVLSFMLFFYEPIMMYASNIDDFWFDLKTIILPLMLLFIGSFVFTVILFGILHYLNNRFFKGKHIYAFFLLIAYAIFFSLYIEGNFLSIFLPPLDGSLTWNGNFLAKGLSFVFWVMPLLLLYYLGRKKTYESVIHISKYVSLGVMVMLLASLFSVLLSSKALQITKNPLILTKDNLTNISKNTNFYILVLDTIDSQNFDSILKESEYQDTFKDFTYYPDTVGAYLYTRDAIPFILSNKWNLNEEDYRDYSTKALNEAPLFQELIQKDYQINIYDTELIWNGKERNIIDNTIPFEGKIGKMSFYKQVLKYLLYKYLPFNLKKYSRVETLDFNVCKATASLNYFSWDNIAMYNTLDEDFKEDDEKYFKFIHLEGAHPPFNSDKDLNKISNGTHEEKEKASLKLVNKFLNKLRDTNSYNNSIIIIMSDHGIHGEDVLGRQNPILYIKGIDEHHEMITSDLPVSYNYLKDIYHDLLDGKKSNELLQNIDINGPRKFIYYRYLNEDHMVEYVVHGKAWEIEKIEPTGKEYNLEK